MGSRREMMTRQPLVVIAACLAATALACFSQVDDSARAQVGPKYKEVTAARGPFRIAVTANGLVRPIDRIELKSKASGEVVELPIEVGDAVAKGQLIAKLDQVEERAELAQTRADRDIARAELALAEKNFERRKKLLSSDVISTEAHDETELALAVARSKLVQATTAFERARERMEDTVISAPVDGIILQKYVEEGQIIASGVSNVGGGTPIADIADMRNVYIEAGVDEIDIGKIAVAQRATIRAEAFPERPYVGEVVRIAPEARLEQNVTLFDVVVHVENTDVKLKSGMNATVEIVIVDEPDTLVIPVAAIQEPDASRGVAREPWPASVVLVKNADGYGAREIRTGRTDYRVVEVLDGLEEGEVLGIPMVSRLKREHDQIEARIRNRQSFGAGGKRDTNARGKSASGGS
ncbi:MAG: efflux RND transporter periplasmic adaptor subunit [Deltaproteobacteria bacterium]|nr:efflux RND transporter periplasmic adaptor subunit [Deltaproteobacteria bacterium]MBW2399905.1 efflux RND transporter periplasmic adaptor subunit [Deltaproteobacteria bacterium]